MKSVSVLMPAYNCGNFIKDAIDSVLNQSFGDFEFLIVDDGSTDETVSVIESYKDDRIVLIRNEHDFIGSLNCGLSLARGKYIARMDADDIMHPDRLRVQYTVMEECPEIDICSSWMYAFGKEISKTLMSTTGGLVASPVNMLLKFNFVYHPTVMLRTDFIRSHQLEYQRYEHAEDFKLWFEIAKRKGVFYIEPQPLLYYRVSSQQVTQQYRSRQIDTTVRIKKEIIDYLIGQSACEREELEKLKLCMLTLNEKELISDVSYFELFYEIFNRLEERAN